MAVSNDWRIPADHIVIPGNSYRWCYNAINGVYRDKFWNNLKDIAFDMWEDCVNGVWIEDVHGNVVVKKEGGRLVWITVIASSTLNGGSSSSS